MGETADRWKPFTLAPARGDAAAGLRVGRPHPMLPGVVVHVHDAYVAARACCARPSWACSR
jgi:hypothetical protein